MQIIHPINSLKINEKLNKMKGLYNILIALMMSITGTSQEFHVAKTGYGLYGTKKK